MQTGMLGENIAADYLRARGYDVRERNVRFRNLEIDIVAYDVGGRRVSTLANGVWNAGRHAFHWTTMGDEGRPLPNGVYFVRFSAGGYQATQRVLVVR